MPKVLIQAGHKDRTSGSTGAPGEQKWTTEIVPKIANKLREKGITVKEVNADPSDAEISGDWDLFLTVHYDADIYNDRGGFLDIPDPSVDFAHQESKRIKERIEEYYFNQTGIPNKPNRSNANTKFYYMWKRLSAKTPCVLIEAGVGWRTPEDHHTLHFEQDRVVKGITDGIIDALLDEEPEPTPDCQQYKDQIKILEKQIEVLETKNGELQKQLEDCQAGQTPDTEWEENGKQVTWQENGKTISVNYKIKEV